MKKTKKSYPLFNFLGYALFGCVLTAALLALTFTGGTFAILVSLAAVALLHSLIGLGYELYKNLKKENLSTLEKIGIGLAIANIAIASLGLMVVFPHIGIPLIGVAAIAGLAFVVSTFPPIHHFFKKLFSKSSRHDEQEQLLHRDAISLAQQDATSLRNSIQNLENRTHSPLGSEKKPANQFSKKQPDSTQTDDDSDSDSPHP